MTQMKNVVVIGDEEIGKTTLINALLGWDILPQSYDGIYIHTETCISQQLTETVFLTDTPGYSLLWNTIPEETASAVSEADTIVIMLSEELAEEMDIHAADLEWETCRVSEAALLSRLLEQGNTRDIYFVLPCDKQEWPETEVPLTQRLHPARKQFGGMTCHGESGFFCIDPMQALIAAIEDDEAALKQSGILPLKAKLTAQ